MDGQDGQDSFILSILSIPVKYLFYFPQWIAFIGGFVALSHSIMR
jgi:hypothetical protein